MIKIRPDLCIGCGHCADDCPQQAISIANKQAIIVQTLCNQCRLCLGLCPRGAIVEIEPVLKQNLLVAVGSLKHKTDDLIRRIEKLQQKRFDVKVE